MWEQWEDSPETQFALDTYLITWNNRGYKGREWRYWEESTENATHFIRLTISNKKHAQIRIIIKPHYLGMPGKWSK